MAKAAQWIARFGCGHRAGDGAKGGLRRAIGIVVALRADITANDALLLTSGYGNWQGGHTGIHDPLWVRALVLDNGQARAAKISAGPIGCSHDYGRQMLERMSGESGIPASATLLTATHTPAGHPLPASMQQVWQIYFLPPAVLRAGDVG